MASMDERLEALVQTAELLMLEGRQLLRSVSKLERSVDKLKDTAASRERRITRLERRAR
jgi:hypothetical protein